VGAAHYGIPIRTGGLDVLASEQNTYDLVTMTELVEHTPDPVQFPKGVSRILKSGGHALVTFPDISSLKSRYYNSDGEADWSRMGVGDMPHTASHLGIH
jgi:2-polyprenyl-3-methyl-5-hydroxy-6-metoxy-1,4-benzoquinol methylase